MVERADTEYHPVDCSLHDRYESWAVRRTLLNVEWTDEEGDVRGVEARISDILVRDGAEYLVLDEGTLIRLDRLREVRPVPRPPASEGGMAASRD